MTAYIRNPAGTAWVPLTSANLRYSNQLGTWAGASESNLKVRYPSGVYGPVLGVGSVSISGMSVSSMTTVMDVTTNGNHQLFTNPPAGYGLWTDGFPNPYRDGSGNTYLPIPHSENFRFRVPDWNNPGSWVLESPTLVSARVASEGSYNNRHWLFGHWASGNTVYALCHHEWYVDMVTSNGVPGFNANNPPGTLFNQRWVNAITWASSTNGGASFAVAPYNDSRRCVLVPEPWYNQQRNHMYGFFHPTNIVQEGGYYYAAVEQRSLSPAGASPENGTGPAGFCADSGMSLIRTTNLAQATGWEFWNGSGWTTVSHATYQGNNSTQVPFRFFPSSNHNFYEGPNNFNSGMGHSIRFHVPSGKWVFFGFTGAGGAGKLGYTVTSSLANPAFSGITPITGSNTADFDAPAGRYFGVFDPDASDQNFMNIGNTCIVLVQRDGVLVRKGTLTITTT